MSERNHLFPALRCRMGDTIYYATFMTFGDVATWIKPTTEIHSSEELSRWIQRQLIKGHAARIADYLIGQKERFFNAIVVGLYGGDPVWAQWRVTTPPGDKSLKIGDEEHEHLESSIGILQLSGEEKLFAIDGQHRVAGIKEALKRSTADLKDDEIIALFVGHKTTKTGERRTRRLFTTLNKTARRVSDADRVALDEDDGFAIVTRRLIDDFDLFRTGEPVAFAPTASLPPNDETSVTTIICLYSQLKDLYSTRFTDPPIKKGHFGGARPPDKALQQVYQRVTEYWESLIKCVPEVRDVFAGKSAAGQYRKPTKNHLLLRPVGQRAFAGAVGVLVRRGATIRAAVERLSKVDLWIQRKAWHEILWDHASSDVEVSGSGRNVSVAQSAGSRTLARSRSQAGGNREKRDSL